MPISISLGYDDKNELEFSGYIASTSIENGILSIRSEDAIYLLRKDVQNQQLTISTIVENHRAGRRVMSPRASKS